MECNKVYIPVGVDVITDELVQIGVEWVQSQLHFQQGGIATATEKHESQLM
jgi:hypothetical protein